jgi:hypothetical protein
VAAVMASLMAEALDVASENFLKLTKYDKLTALSRCQCYKTFYGRKL